MFAIKPQIDELLFLLPTNHEDKERSKGSNGSQDIWIPDGKLKGDAASQDVARVGKRNLYDEVLSLQKSFGLQMDILAIHVRG